MGGFITLLHLDDPNSVQIVSMEPILYVSESQMGLSMPRFNLRIVIRRNEDVRVPVLSASLYSIKLEYTLTKQLRMLMKTSSRSGINL